MAAAIGDHGTLESEDLHGLDMPQVSLRIQGQDLQPTCGGKYRVHERAGFVHEHVAENAGAALGGVRRIPADRSRPLVLKFPLRFIERCEPAPSPTAMGVELVSMRVPDQRGVFETVVFQ